MQMEGVRAGRSVLDIPLLGPGAGSWPLPPRPRLCPYWQGLWQVPSEWGSGQLWEYRLQVADSTGHEEAPAVAQAAEEPGGQAGEAGGQ